MTFTQRGWAVPVLSGLQDQLGKPWSALVTALSEATDLLRPLSTYITL